jgi:hypothetical protein
MKKGLVLLLVLMVIVTGCASTTPALRDVWLKQWDVNSVESETIIKFAIESREPIVSGEEERILLDVLSSGIKIEQKVVNETNSYSKLSLVNPGPLAQLPEFPPFGEELFAEFYMVDGVTYARTSFEERLVKMDNEMNGLQGLEGQSLVLSVQDQKKLKEFALGQLKGYVGQFDFKLRQIQDLGHVQVATPVGNQTVKHLQVQMTIDDVIGFVSYLLGNLAEYPGLKPLIAEGQAMFLPADEQMSDSELDIVVAQIRGQLTEAKMEVSQYNEAMLEDMIRADMDFLWTTDAYVTDSAETVALNNTISIKFKQRATQEMIGLKFTTETKRWNMNQPVTLPTADFAAALGVKEMIHNRKLLNELGENSIIKEMIKAEYPRRGSLTVGNKEAYVGKRNEKTSLEAAPYVTPSGQTMVPIKVISEIAMSPAKWDSATKKVTFEVDGTQVVLTLDSSTALVNGQKVVMPVAAESVKGRTFVPLRFVTENLGAVVEFDNKTKSITIDFDAN